MLVLSTVGFNFQVVIPLLADRSFAGAGLRLLAADGRDGASARSPERSPSARKKRVSRELITLSALGFGVTSLLAAAAPTLPLEMLSLGLLGVCSVTFAAGINSGLQLAAAPEMRGRVMAIYSIVFLGSTVVGGPIAGWLGEAVSPRAPLRGRGTRRVSLVAVGAYFAWSERFAAAGSPRSRRSSRPRPARSTRSTRPTAAAPIARRRPLRPGARRAHGEALRSPASRSRGGSRSAADRTSDRGRRRSRAA